MKAVVRESHIYCAICMPFHQTQEKDLLDIKDNYFIDQSLRLHTLFQSQKGILEKKRYHY